MRKKNSTAILVSVIVIVIAALVVWYFVGTSALQGPSSPNAPVSGQLQGTVVPSNNG